MPPSADNPAEWPKTLSAGLVLLLSLPIALILGFASGEELAYAVGGAGVLLVTLGFVFSPSSVPIKLIFLLITVTFLQRIVGYFRAESVRGLNVGNLLLAATAGYWIWNGLKRGRLYRPTPVDLWLFLMAIAVPVFSIYYATFFRQVDDYSFYGQLSWYKQWVTPYLYFFVLCQCLDTRRDIRLLYGLVACLVGIAVLESLPEVFQFSYWRDSRAEGFVGQPNEYAALLSVTAPFIFLVAFLAKDKPVIRFLAFVLACGMAVATLLTYSRAGYLGFALALAGAVVLTYRSTGRIPLGTPALVICAVCAVPFMAAPQLLEFLKNRFEPSTYMQSKRRSYSDFNAADRYAGGRLEYWQCALQMAEERPILGSGFHSFLYELPKYHSQQHSNYCHNQYLTVLAEGGVVWLSIFLMTIWKFLSLLYHSWRVHLKLKDTWGQIICGGAFLELVVLLWLAMSNDVLGPGPKNVIIWVLLAGGVRYGMLPPEEPEVEAQSAGPPTGP